MLLFSGDVQAPCLQWAPHALIIAAILYTAKAQYRKFETPEKELRGLSVSVSDLYIPTIGLPILLQENMGTDPGNI